MPRKPPAPSGAPEWVVTYGDMMSLLLTFFILLAALSEIKSPDRYKTIIREVQQNFGLAGGGGGPVALLTESRVSLIRKLEQLEKKHRERELSQSPDVGQDGRNPAVTRVREGTLFAVGGRITFAPGSAELPEPLQRHLRQVAELIGGYTNKIEIRGHASARDLVDGSTYPDLWSLSHARARAVADFLVTQRLGVDPARIRIMSCGDSEPVVLRRYTQEDQEPNRRVEILVSESLVEDLRRAEAGTP